MASRHRPPRPKCGACHPVMQQGLLCVLLQLVYAQAQAQALPDAGALRPQIERERAPDTPPRPPPLRLPRSEEHKDTGSQELIAVHSFRFAGNSLLADAQLLAAVQPYANRPLRLDELWAAAAAVAADYRQAGWVARVYVPQQDITQGVVTLQIVEAAFSGTRISGSEPLRLKSGDVLSIASANLRQGSPLNTAAVDRVLLLADDLPGVSVSGALSEGPGEGETGLVLRLTDEPLLSGEVFVDNQGPRSSGSERTVLSASLNSPLGLGDRLAGDLLHTQGTDYVRVAYSLPVFSDGLRLGVTASQFNYRLVAEEFASLHSSGAAEGVGLEASYPLLRTGARNLSLGMAYDRRRYLNEANHAVQSRYQVDVFGITLAGNLSDKLAGGGYTTASISLVNGQLDYGSPDAAENPALEGSFQKWRYALARHQTLTPTLSLVGTLSGQQAGHSLDSSESFYLGGPAGVRAYPANEGGGAQGLLASLELRYRFAKDWQLTAFYDHGSASGAGANIQLAGYGLGLTWKGPYDAVLKAVYAHRLGSNPNPTASGRDQDGSLELDRWWLSLSLPF